MRNLLGLLLGFCVLLPVMTEARTSGRAKLGGQDVAWSTVDKSIAKSAGVERPLSLILFNFPMQLATKPVSEAQWEKEAKRQGVDVSTLKVMLGTSVYVTKNGTLASCTMNAISKGLCGKARTLPLESRVEAARSILEQSGKCKWVGFDTNVHKTMATLTGAEEVTLWVAADCR